MGDGTEATEAEDFDELARRLLCFMRDKEIDEDGHLLSYTAGGHFVYDYCIDSTIEWCRPIRCYGS